MGITRAVIYTRISRDPEDEKLGVERQEKDLRREAERRKARVVAVLSDNDISGEGKKERPDFDRLIEMIRSGDVDLVLTTDLDRVTRGFSPFVKFYTACQDAKILVAWLGGQADFRTGVGLLELEIRASFAHEELRKIRSRIMRKHLELAEAGKDVGGTRAFGYDNDRSTLRPTSMCCRVSDHGVYELDEPQLIREAADKVLSGGSLRSIAVDWTRRGIPTFTGRPWTVTVIKRILCSARISGRRERVTFDGAKKMVGTITNDHAEWASIISVEKSDALRRYLGNPDRRKNGQGNAQTYLLTGGIAVCGVCEKPLIARPRGDHRRCMVCASGPGNHGCGKIRTLAEPLEALIVKVVLHRIDGGALARAMTHKEDSKLAAELLAVEGRMEQNRREWAAGEITIAERNAARQVLVERQATLTKTLDGSRRAVGLDGLPADLRSAWPTLELHRQRAIVMALIETVTVKPAIRGRNTFDKRRIDVTWKA